MLLGLETASGAMKSLVSDFEVEDCRHGFGEWMNFYFWRGGAKPPAQCALRASTQIVPRF